MSLQINRMVSIRRLAINYAIPVLIGVLLVAGIANGEKHSFSDEYSMQVDPVAKQKLGEDSYNQVIAFFHAAEKAIEEKDLKTLISLYSDNYKDGEHDKKSAEQIWERIFSTFDGMATHHNMKFVSMSADKNTVILSCSGLLLGVPDLKERLISIDNWTLQDHVLVKEAGKWKLIGTYGKDRKRLWFDKPMHPLF